MAVPYQQHNLEPPYTLQRQVTTLPNGALTSAALAVVVKLKQKRSDDIIQEMQKGKKRLNTKLYVSQSICTRKVYSAFTAL